MTRQIVALARMVKIEHSIFALPFAYVGLFWAARGWPGWKPFLLVTLAMVAVRSFAMAFNRVADVKFDRLNPRTQNRPLITGEISMNAARIFCVVTAAIFVLACYFMNSLVFALSPVALLIAGGYSLTKRFTWLCHFVLGMTLGFAPLGGWMAVTPEFSLPAVLLALGVTFWVAGFDLLYACQDTDFDRSQELNSMPACFGVGTSLAISSFCHVNTALFFLLAGWAAQAGGIYFIFMVIIGLIMVLEHLLISEDDMSRVNLAFFTLNGVIAVAVFVGVLADLIFQ
ncbi:MAG: UbiA-like polyprenyltransferase [Desulfovibrio sp.]|uniref:UbiA-like polyprenyltransferase n=1 Tax=Desulfovibrio sp. 7SRBS1 TaxID=3378064 RepID=UPI003B3F25FA